MEFSVESRTRRAPVTELRCANCRQWWRPEGQPPASDVRTCSARCRVALHRAEKKALKS